MIWPNIVTVCWNKLIAIGDSKRCPLSMFKKYSFDGFPSVRCCSGWAIWTKYSQHDACRWNYESLLWCHNGRDGVSNHQPHDCLLNHSFRRIWEKTSKHRVTGLCAGNVTGEFLAQMASNEEIFPFDDVIMCCRYALVSSSWLVVHLHISNRGLPDRLSHSCYLKSIHHRLFLRKHDRLHTLNNIG